jgi:long-chain acyl-CoA synthetase
MKIDSLLFSKESDSFRIYDSSGLVDVNKIRNDVAEASDKLRSISIRPYENIAIICDNHSCFLTALLSIISAGAVAVPIDPQISSSSLKEIIEKFNIRYAFIYGKRAEELFNNNDICNYIFHYDNSKWVSPINIELSSNKGQQVLLDSDLNPAIILLTSGTVGLVHKGVLISHENIINNIESIIDYMQPQKTESLYIAKSLSHISSVIGELLMALSVGMTLYIYNPVVPYSVLIKRIIQCKPDYLVVNPTLLHFLVKYAENESEIPEIKGIYTCGGFASSALINKARNTFSSSKVYNMYGLTEAGPRVTSQTDAPDNYEAGFAGKPIKNVSVKIINDSGEARINEEGRIIVKSNALMVGYYGDPELTKEKIQNGWLITGDIGYLNANQELYVSGRADDVVIRSGKNINLNTIEDIISEIDEIRECIVFSIPDTVHQNKVICAYVKNGDKPVDISMVREHCLKKLFPYECPQQIIEWDSIPKTNTNKKSRKKASELYRKSIT